MPEEFARETRELMLRRVRIGIVLGSSILLAFILVDIWRIAPARYPVAVGLRLAGIALLLPMIAVTRARNAVRWAEWIGAAVLLVLMATTAAIMPLFGGAADPQYAIQGTGIVFCILGSGLLLPFDATTTLALGLLGLALHVGFTVDLPLGQNFPILFATLTSVVIATVGAGELTASRLAEFTGRRAKEELLLARADFVAMLTHDIKNPLSVIQGFAQMMREQPEMRLAEREEILSRVQRAAGDAITLAVNFLDASKIDAGRLVLHKVPTDIGDLLRGALSDQRAYAEHKGIHLLDDGDAMLPAADVDAAALGRVFANLLGNAIKHTPAGGTVRVVTRRSAADQIEIVVEDTGDGIPPGEESRIFERYTGAATRADSTGLGLFIARTFTTAHGGSIRAENRNDRRGARFCVTLPAVVAKPTTA